MKLSRNQDYDRIKFTEENFKIEEPEKEVIVDQSIRNKQAKNLLPKKLNNSNAISNRTESQILAAGMGTIKDIGGPKKYMGSQTNNSIWDNEIIEKLSKVPDNKEKTKTEVEDIKKMKKERKDQRINEIVEGLKNTDTRKDANIVKMNDFEKPSLFKRPKNAISIFDTLEGKNDFDRVPEKTDGEKMVERIKESKKKDKIWKDKQGIVSTSNIFNSMFDNMENQNDK
jgi:hypothetical protein